MESRPHSQTSQSATAPAHHPVREDEDEPPPEVDDWDLETNRKHLHKLLSDEWRHWGRPHRQEFVNAIVATVQAMIPEERSVEADENAPNPKTSV